MDFLQNIQTSEDLVSGDAQSSEVVRLDLDYKILVSLFSIYHQHDSISMHHVSVDRFQLRHVLSSHSSVTAPQIVVS